MIAVSSMQRAETLGLLKSPQGSVVRVIYFFISWLLTIVVNPEDTQENIMYARALNSEVSKGLHCFLHHGAQKQVQHQLELLNALAQSFASNEYRLLIIDSIMNCFRVDYSGRGELAERQQKLNQFLSRLSQMAEGIWRLVF